MAEIKERNIMIGELKALMRYAIDGNEVDYIFNVWERTHDTSELLHTLKVFLVSAKTHHQNLQKIIDIQFVQIEKLRQTDFFVGGVTLIAKNIQEARD